MAAEPAAKPPAKDEPPTLDSLLPLPTDGPATSDEIGPRTTVAAGAPPAAARVQISESLALNLINRLVERGVLTQADAADLIKVAQADAEAARQEREAMFAAAQAAAEAPPASDSDVRVTYVPETVKDEMREQIKDEVLKQAKDERWIAPTVSPDWVQSWKPFGDIRLRFQYDRYPAGNDNTGSFPNFNAINTGLPYDVAGTQFSPQYNADQDRQRVRLRLRLGTEIDLGDHFTAGVRIGTGETNSPVSGNQSFGLASGGQGGNFSKYAIWLDRAFLRWEPVDSLAITIGRFDNPFFSSTAIWSEDIGFDGVVLQSHYEVYDGIEPFVTAGSFPIFNTDLNFASNQGAKFESRDKWLNAAQLGVDWQISKHWHAKVAAAYYDFRNVEGVLSSPYAPRDANDAGDTDGSRPSFAQKGNTYRPLRNIIPDATNNFGTINQFQYYGLATPFRVSAVTARLDYDGFEPFRVSLLAEYLKNHAFNSAAINSVAVNNRGASGQFEGGDTAYYLDLRVGKAAMEKRGDWVATLGYQHVESDAVIDGFNDQNFGGGGTNLKGYTISAAIALSPRVQMALRYMSASQIAGPQYKNDIIQFDISAKF